MLSGVFCLYRLLAAAVVTAAVITAVITATADEKKDYDKNPSAVVTAERIATHIFNPLSTTSFYAFLETVLLFLEKIKKSI